MPCFDVISDGIVESEVHVENASEFIMVCKNEDYGLWNQQSCRDNKVYLPSNDNANVIINCYGSSCYDTKYYAQNGWSDNYELNIFSLSM